MSVWILAKRFTFKPDGGEVFTFKGLESILATWLIYNFIIAVIKLSRHLDSPWYIRLLYKGQMWSLGKLLTVAMLLKHI